MKKTAQKKSKKEIWFKAKNFGWGWYPSTWQGWTIIFFYFVLVSVNYCRIQTFSVSENDMLNYFVPETIAFSVILILICFLKGEKPKWRWGNEKK